MLLDSGSSLATKRIFILYCLLLTKIRHAVNYWKIL